MLELSYILTTSEIPCAFKASVSLEYTYVFKTPEPELAWLMVCCLTTPSKLLSWFVCITMTSEWAQWRLKSPASRLFTEAFIRAQIKGNIKARRHWPLCGEFTGDRWIPRTNGQQRGKCFHLMTSSCEEWIRCYWKIFVSMSLCLTTYSFIDYCGTFGWNVQIHSECPSYCIV